MSNKTSNRPITVPVPPPYKSLLEMDRRRQRFLYSPPLIFWMPHPLFPERQTIVFAPLHSR